MKHDIDDILWKIFIQEYMTTLNYVTTTIRIVPQTTQQHIYLFVRKPIGLAHFELEFRATI
jgi:hypothetical protein